MGQGAGEAGHGGGALGLHDQVPGILQPAVGLGQPGHLLAHLPHLLGHPLVDLPADLGQLLLQGLQALGPHLGRHGGGQKSSQDVQKTLFLGG